MRISDWSSDVCSSDLQGASAKRVFAMISFLRLKDSFQPQPASLGRPHRGESDMVELIISLIAGAVGGNAAAKIFNSIDMGVVVNSIAGIVGGGLGGPLIAALLGGAGISAEPRRGGEGCGSSAVSRG